VRLVIYQQLSTQAKALLWAGFWTATYLILVVALPPSAATMHDYHLSSVEFRILSLLTGLPIAMVWFTSFFGYAALGSYAEKVDSSPEGASFAAVARGLKWLAWGLPINTCVAALLSGIARLNPDFVSAALIISHYTYLIISLVAFTYMSDGSRGLRDIVNKLPSKLAIRGMILASIVLSVTYCTVTLGTIQDQHPNSYRLPLWLILLTIIIPYLYAWLMGFFAVFEISQYRRSVRGLFYKQALRLLASGTTLAIVASVALQYLTSSSRYLRRIDLSWTLLFSYLIMITFAVGFILIALGAAKLKKMEEV
jgi:hypothetical protein